MSEKLQKHLAHLGFASRRAIEEWIKDGRITLNGRTAKLGDRVTEKDVITVDNKPVNPPEGQQDTRVILLHKPVGVICTRNDPEGRPTVFDGLPKIRNARWVSIGRLDINTSGLLLFTNNGELANKLMHPSRQVEREYAVRVLGDVTQSMLKKLTQGVMLDDGKARFEHLVDSGGKGANHWYHVVVVEGRNRVVRRLWESQDLTVSRLQRVRYGPIVLPKSVPRGRWVELDAKQVESLLAM